MTLSRSANIHINNLPALTVSEHRKAASSWWAVSRDQGAHPGRRAFASEVATWHTAQFTVASNAVHWEICARLAARLESERPGEANFSAADFQATCTDCEIIAMDKGEVPLTCV